MTESPKITLFHRCINIPTTCICTVFVVLNNQILLFSKKPRGKQLSEVEKSQIEVLRSAGKTYSFIVNKLKRPKGFMQDFISKRRSPGLKTRKDRPRKVTARDERQISRTASN